MGKRDLKFLKKSLKEIYKKNAEIAKLQEKKKINSKELAKSKKLIEKLESDNQFQQLDLDDLTQLWGDSIPDSLTVNQLKDILHGYGLPVSGNKKELKKRIIRYSRTSRAEKTISSGTLVELRENVKKVTKKVQLDEKRRELNRHPVYVDSEGFLLGWWIAAIIILALGMMHWETQRDSYFEQGFDCGNGETIHGSKVLDDKEDCSNGNDERTNWFTSSAAESYSMDEPMPVLGCCGSIIVLGIGYGAAEARNDSAREMNKKKEGKLADKVAKAEREVRDANLLLRKEERKQDKIKKNDEEIQKLTKNIGKMQKYKETVSIEIKELKQQRNNLYGEIKHLIPYSDLL